MSRSIPLKALLRQHRLDRDLTMEALSESSGISDRAISDIERGVSATPQRHTVVALADALSLDADERDAFFAAARARRRAPSVEDDEEIARLRPHWIDDFTGREADVSRIVEMLGSMDGSRNVTTPVIISGTPGVGKTSVAVEALRRARPDGHRELFLDLQGVGKQPLTPLQVLRGLLRQLTEEPAHAPAGAERAPPPTHGGEGRVPVVRRGGGCLGCSHGGDPGRGDPR